VPYSSELALNLFLQRLGSRSPLGEDETSAILQLTGQQATAGGDRDLVGPGERVEHACLIVSGLVGRFGQMRDGRRQITAIWVPGHMANLQSVVFPSTAMSLQALTPTTVIKLPHRALQAATQRYPALADAFWRECAVDASVLQQWVVNIGRKSAVGRLAHLLAELGLRMEEAGLGTHTAYPLEATQVHIGEALGLSAVHVNRVFKELRDNKVIAVTRRSITILDWQALVRIGEFDPDYLHINTKFWAIPSRHGDDASVMAGIGGQRLAG
jgi:CRP-like cAMP-binding protein